MMCGQLKEFILRYFVRLCQVREPEPVPAGLQAPRSGLPRAMSWLPDNAQQRPDAGYQQLYYKLAATGQIGKFAKVERRAIVDLRDIGPKYDWIVLKVDLFSFDLPFAPFGSEGPKLQVPLKESTYLVMGPAFVTNADHPEPGVLAEYGFGYAFVPYAPDGPGVLAWGPGHLRAAIQRVSFRLLSDGEIRARAVFIVNRPDRIAAVDVDPIGWGMRLADLVTLRMASWLMSPVLTMTDRLPLRANGVDPIAAYIWMANTMTGGMAEKHFGISKTVLEKRMLLQRFKQHHEMLHSSLQIWRMVPDWTAHDELPEYCRRGAAC